VEQYSHLTRRVLFLLVTLALTAGPTFYIAIVENQPSGSGSLALILGFAQFFISIGANLLFGIMPSGRVFGDQVARKSRKYLASETFTASYPTLFSSAPGERLLWFLVFGCKFMESYLFLTLAFRDPIRAMAGMKIQNCHEKSFGDSLCRNHAIFTLRSCLSWTSSFSSWTRSCGISFGILPTASLARSFSDFRLGGLE
jgi:1,3-beta-glucan synthase